MGGPSATLDVRDMLCAQALAQTDRALRGLSVDGALEVRCNTQEVVQDLLTWASDQGHIVVHTKAQDGETRITLQRARR